MAAIDEELYLKHFLRNIQNSTSGTLEIDLNFGVFSPVQDSFFEIEDKRLNKPLELTVWDRDPGRFSYTVESEQGRCLLLSYEGDWEFKQGIVNPDNIRGAHYLRMPLSNFIPGTEARLYASTIENVVGVNVSETRKVRK